MALMESRANMQAAGTNDGANRARYETVLPPLITPEWFDNPPTVGVDKGVHVVAHSYPTPNSENGFRTVKIVPLQPRSHNGGPEPRPWDEGEAVFAEFTYDSSQVEASPTTVLHEFLSDHGPDAGLRLGYLGLKSTRYRETPEGKPYDSFIGTIMPRRPDKIAGAAKRDPERTADLNSKLPTATAPSRKQQLDPDETQRVIREEKIPYDEKLPRSLPIIEQRISIADGYLKGQDPDQLAVAHKRPIRYILWVLRSAAKKQRAGRSLPIQDKPENL